MTTATCVVHTFRQQVNVALRACIVIVVFLFASPPFGGAIDPASLEHPEWSPVAPTYSHVLVPQILALQGRVSNGAIDHCHWQACLVRGRRTVPQELCTFERTVRQRVECLEQRRGRKYSGHNHVSTGSATDAENGVAPLALSLVDNTSTPPWPLQQINGAFKPFVFVKNMKTGGSTLKTVLEKLSLIHI